jgi:predicted unusual protein kinase regulating ubiquinone biosynthesis (AarF/ABC1/UbiB family)
MSPHNEDARKLERTRRLAEIAGTGVSLGSKAILHRAKLATQPRDRRSELETEYKIKTAEEVRARLGNMRGVFMKLAQMASYVDERVPPAAREAFAQLQSDAPPMEWKLAQQVFESSMGRRIKECFSTIDEEPIAAASIGQVHRATTLQGATVAVKIQYPEAAAAMTADLRNTALLSRLLKSLFPSMETDKMAQELKDRFLEELDYRHEASIQHRFASYYDLHPTILVPKVFDHLTSDRVLTTEYVEGRSFEEIAGSSQSERDLFGETLFRFVFRSLYQMNLFNGDPHPGNYLFLENGRVAFLDFGFSRSFSPDELSIFESLVQSMVVTHDIHHFRCQAERAGLLLNAEAISDEAVAEYFRVFYEIVEKDRTLRISPEYCSTLISQSFSTRHEIASMINVPPSFVVIQRINMGLYAILATLGSEVNWRRVAEEIWPFTLSPPSSDLGHAEAAWLKSKAGN